ncbi:WD40-repeat-containing domain protein [Phlyctochytrium arcticum]|nr:WD40-repeat-containing domain protein [Phlyctochytrium arcticum]
MASEEELAMMAAMGLPVGFGAVKKDRSVEMQKAMEETRRVPVRASEVAEKPLPNKPGNVVDAQGSDSDDDIGPQPAPDQDKDSDDDDDDDDDGSDSGFEAHEADTLPITHQTKMKDHMRTVSALSVDPSGSRFATGGRDCNVKLWDFQGMDSTFRPFRTFEASEGNPIRDVQFSSTGDQLLIASTSAQAKLYDRDGIEIVEYIKGDPYIRDPRHTKGHIAALTCCRWHPFERGLFLTASLDGTIRLWDSENKREQTQVIVIKSRQPGGRTAIGAAGFSPDGKLIVGGANDGALRLWNAKGPFLRPTHTIENAHMSGAGITCATFSIANNLIATRAMDDTLKIWDVRKFTKPVAVQSNLENFFEETNVIFSPNDRYILTGTSVKKDQGAGKLHIFERDTLKPVQEIDVTTSSVVRVQWHGRINQILMGTGDGSVQVLYDPLISMAGVKTALAKRPKQRAVDDLDLCNDDSNRIILTPNALPMYKDELPRSSKRKSDKSRGDPTASRKPDGNNLGPGKGGKIGTSLTQHILKNLVKDTTRDEDPREAILKHAKDAEENPYWVAPAYRRNAPTAIYANAVYEDDDEAERAAAKKRRQ